MPCLGNSGINQNGGGARLRIVAAVLGKGALEFGRTHVVGIGGFRIGIDPVALLHRAPQLHMPLHYHIKNPLIFVGELILIQFSEAQGGLQHHVPGTGLELPAQYFHQR